MPDGMVRIEGLQVHVAGVRQKHPDREPSEDRDLERAEDPRAQLESIVDGLHSGGPARELVMPEVRLARARGNDQAVVRDLELDAVGP